MDMEETQVVIVGAGPAGLTLGLCLAQYEVTSLILEKETEVTTDPRGVYLTGDALRILYDLGLGPSFQDIGHVVETINFHKSTFCQDPFFTMDIVSDVLNQGLPTGMLQMQPRLEHTLRRQIELSKWCTLRTGCEVVSILGDNPPTIEYKSKNGSQHQVRGQWLVGADGKVGIVRKYFLEPTAGIRQEEGKYRYTGTWIAANLKLQVPTRQTHPEFPLWELGFTDEQVYDLFWPQGWHFCSPPGKATASGRFGPYSERLWRHEFRQDNWDDNMDAVELFWDHLGPMIIRERDQQGRIFPKPVHYPRDCIEVLRCRPFRFVHKVVNKWFDKRTILIGDAAHVFPPFAGQGIGSGIRDAHQLAWRIALFLQDTRIKEHESNSILEQWALERRQSVNDAALFSMLNGRLCNHEPSFLLLGLLRLLKLLVSIPILRRIIDPQGLKERKGFSTVPNGFFLEQYRGGVRLAQIAVQSFKRGPNLSDRILRSNMTILTLLVISNGNHIKLKEGAQDAIKVASISPAVLSKDSVILFNPNTADKVARNSTGSQEDQMEIFWPVSRSPFSSDQKGYDPGSFIDRLGRSTVFALIRPDFYVFSCAKDVQELGKCLHMLKSQLYNGQG